MLRRLIYLLTFAVVGLLLLVALAVPEVRVGFVSLSVAVIVGALWVARRLPLRPMSIRELRVDAAIALIAAVGLAVWIPSTRVICDCPMPSGAPAGFSCPCAIDHHMLLRLCVALVGVVLAVALAALARSRRMPSLAS
jgi:hypothetical protein